MKHAVLITDRLSDQAYRLLANEETLNIRGVIDQFPDAKELSDIEALLIRSRTRIDKGLLEKLPALKIIVTCTSGFDHIDLNETLQRKIEVHFVPSANCYSAAELTWGLVLSCARKLLQADRKVRDGNWRRDPLQGVELFGKTYGIVGLGRVGGHVAQIAKAFGMRVVAYDPYVEPNRMRELNCEPLSLFELQRLSDVISIHVPLTLETRHMFRRDSLESISPHGILVNTSRGPIICEKDLASVLSEGHLGAVGLDVYEYEPLSNKSPLLHFPNVVLTPHVGALTDEAFNKASVLGAEKVIRFFNKSPIPNDERLPPTEAWYTHPRGFN